MIFVTSVMQVETIEHFYKTRAAIALINSNPDKSAHFNVFPRGGICHELTAYQRTDFYKIALSLGGGTLSYADKSIDIGKSALIFFNPNVPCAWEASQEDQSGYFCLFKEGFINSSWLNAPVLNSPLFKSGGNPVYMLNSEQVDLFEALFKSMIKEVASDYSHKYDVLRNYVNLIIHEALRLEHAKNYTPASASYRVADLFTDLLERQFPIDSPQYTLKLKTAKDYADKLAVHVNYLNRAVKEATGKTTTEHISERIIKEAKAMLKYTGWNIAEIAYCLGFGYSSYFNNFFKKQTGLAPSAFRASNV